MRKFYSLLAATIIAASSFAQTATKIEGRQFPIGTNNTRNFKNLGGKLDKADPISNWYFPQYFVANQATLKTSVDFMLPDTNAKYINADGTIDNRANAAIAQILDPKDGNIDLMDQTQGVIPTFSKFTNFSVDSISFDYLYVRRVDSISYNGNSKVELKDTLFIYYFKGAQISKKTYVLVSDPNAKTTYGYLGWDFTTQTPINYFKVDTLLLGISDNLGKPGVDGWKLATKTLATPSTFTVNASNGSNTNNLVAFSLKYKPGIKYDTSFVMEDRRDSSVIPQNTKWVNYFGFQSATNQGVAVDNNAFYNTSLYSQNHFAFQTVGIFNGWAPGTIYTSNRYLTTGFYLTSTNVGIREKTDNFVLGNAFPNPTTDAVSISFRMKSNDNVNISVFNLLGEKVAEVTNGNFATGEHSVNVNLGSLKAGVYLYTMTTGVSSQTQKLIIAE
ncbi:MAG: T9SS type A sorting domain-containing protein [Bacteroidetes bacterium]|nr:T9SS type A sorting domain-containing protein [Bacteroidota bacterium]